MTGQKPVLRNKGEIKMTNQARDAVGDYKAGWHDPENSTIRFDAG